MLIATLVLLHLLGFISSVRAILQSRTAQGAIAWVISLNTLPLLSVPLFWIFGRNKFAGYVEAWRQNSHRTQHEIDQVSEQLQPFFVDTPQHFPEYEALKSLARYPFVSGNQAELLYDGEQTYQSMEAGIDAAQQYILFQFYALNDDEAGNRFFTKLLAKAQAGIAVYILFDTFGSSAIPKQWRDKLKGHDLMMLPFNNQQGPQNPFKLNFRNHRKLMVVDGQRAWLGGINIGDNYLGKHARLTPWRDTHLQIAGPVVLAAQTLFFSDWHWASGVFLSELNWRPHPVAGGDKNILLLGTGPADPQETASLFMTNLINMARQRIWIASPYFIPDEASMAALRLALLKKIEVRILTPVLNDSYLVQHAAHVYLSELARLGAIIHFYEEGFMHQKVMLVDDQLSVVGTINFDNRSFRLNFEVAALIADQGFAQRVEAMLLQDFEQASVVRDEYLSQRALLERLKAKSAVLLAPIL